MILKNIIFSVLLILIIFIIIIFLIIILKKENIYFYSRKETANFIQKDADNYIKSMSSIDLFARKYPNNISYLNAAVNASSEFTNSEKNEILIMMNSIKKIMKKTMMNFVKKIYFSKLKNNDYEDGYPHTRYNIIFLSPLFFINKNKLQILMHEVIHIYQRYNPILTEIYLNNNGFKKIGNFQSLYPNLYKLRRSNSDIDENIWLSPDNKLMFPIFSSEFPSSLNDVIDNKMEHPYEWMAYKLEKLVNY